VRTADRRLAAEPVLDDLREEPVLPLETAARLFARHRPLVALFVVTMTLMAGWGVSRLQFDDVPRGVFKTADGDYQDLQQLFADFESDDGDCLIVVESDELFSRGSVAALRKLIDSVKGVDGVKAVRSLADVVVFDSGRPRSLLPADDAPESAFTAARNTALSHPLIRGQVLTEDCQTALVIARLDSRLVGIDAIKPVVQEIDSIAHRVSNGTPLVARLTGVPPIRVEIYDMVRRETRRFVIIGVVLAFAMALFLFRQVWASLIVASAPILASFWTMGALGLVGERLNIINTILPTLILVVGFADSMHLMTDIRHSLAEGLTPLEAAKSAIRHLLIACLLTASTTAIGFGALSLAEVDIIRRFGMAAAAGSGLSFLAVMTIVPLLASTRLGEHIRAAHSQDFIVRNFHVFSRILDWVLRHARPVTLVGIAITLLFATSMWRLIPDNSLVEMIPRDNESYRALRHLDENLGGSLSIFVVVEWDPALSLQKPEVLAALQEVESLLASKPQLHYPLSVLDLLRSLPLPVDDLAPRVALLPAVPPDVRDRYYKPASHRALVVARLPDLGSARSRPLFDELDRDLAALEKNNPGVHFYLTGTSVVAARSVHKMIESLNQSLLGAGVAIFGAIGLGFRSVRLALISVLPNLFPMVATATLLVITGRPLQMTSVMVFSICLGIAVDDTIHFLNRFTREVTLDANVPAAIQRTFRAVGSAVISTTIVLLTGFGSVLTSEMPSSRLFGWLACAAFMTAVLGDLLLLPALLLLFYRPKRGRGATMPEAPELWHHPARIVPPTASNGEPAADADSADRVDDSASRR
jgi:predicted RND superfamily exporter protein